MNMAIQMLINRMRTEVAHPSWCFMDGILVRNNDPADPFAPKEPRMEHRYAMCACCYSVLISLN